MMPTHFQQRNVIKFSLKTDKMHQKQKDGNKLLVILNRKLQNPQQQERIIPTTRKKRRCNPANSDWKSHNTVPEIKDTATATFNTLITELEFSYDCLAIINVVYTSLRHTYSDSKGSMQQQGNDTRLCDMEKELLIAYDDLNLQINQLEKSIIKMEQMLMQLKLLEA